MAIEPFNTILELKNFCSFEQGDAAISNGTFKLSQFDLALSMARSEIARSTKNQPNENFAEDRIEELTSAEKYLALGHLYWLLSERQGRYQQNANAANVGEFGISPDSPSNIDRSNHWLAKSDEARKRGLYYLHSPSNVFKVSVSRLRPHQCYQPQSWCRQELYGYPYQGGCLGGY